MHALSPQAVVEKIFQNREYFLGTTLSFTTSSGGTFSGELMAIGQDGGNFSAVLRSGRAQDRQWVGLRQVESVSIHNATEQQLAIVSGAPFDPLAGQAEPGKLALTRFIQEHENRIGGLLSKPVKINFSENALATEGPDRALQLTVLKSTLDLLTIVIEKNFSDSYSKDQIGKIVTQIVLHPGTKTSIERQGTVIKLECPWKEPTSRWMENSMKEALNNCF